MLWSSRKCLHILACHGEAVLEQVFTGHLESATGTHANCSKFYLVQEMGPDCPVCSLDR